MSFMKRGSFRRFFGVLFLLAFGVLLYSCGGGGTTTSSTGAGLYITDDITTDFQQVIVTIYKVEFQRAADKSLVTAFEDPQGITYDLTELSGILEKIGTLPAGTYNRVFITVGESLILVDDSGVQISPDPTFAENRWTACSDGQCVIEVTGAANVVDNQRVVLDFDLKRFVYDSVTNTVAAKIVLDADCSEHERHMEVKEDDYDLKGLVQAVSDGSFDLMVFKARHITLSSNVVTVLVDSSTEFTCDDDDDRVDCPVSSLTDLKPGMKVEVEGSWNGSEFEATLVEVDEDCDLMTLACDVPDRSITEFSDLGLLQKLESTAYTFDSSDYSMTVLDKTILITKETRIVDETGETEQLICADQIPAAADEIIVKYFEGLDSLGNSAYVSYKIEFKSGD